MSVTVVFVESPLDQLQRAPAPASNGVTRPIQSDDSRGEQRTGSFWPRPPTKRLGHPVEHLAVGQDARAADLDLWPVPSADPGRRQVGEHVVDGDRLRGHLQPGGRDHRRQPLDEVAQGAVRLASRADDHAGAEVGERRAVLGEDPGGLVAAAQARVASSPPR